MKISNIYRIMDIYNNILNLSGEKYQFDYDYSIEERDRMIYVTHELKVYNTKEKVRIPFLNTTYKFSKYGFDVEFSLTNSKFIELFLTHMYNNSPFNIEYIEKLNLQILGNPHKEDNETV